MVISEKGWLLINVKDGSPVSVGDTVTDFRGNTATVEGGIPPWKPSSSGRINTSRGEYFPSVFDCRWVMQ